MSSAREASNDSAFVCDCDRRARSACAGESFYKEHEGKSYCVLHFPGKEKSAEFKEVFQRKLDDKDFDFRGVWFPDELSFFKFDFSVAANFMDATFDAAVSFLTTTFSEVAYFNHTTFNREFYFGEATFKGAAFFDGATFNANASFVRANFSGALASFAGAIFNGRAFFLDITFSGEVQFSSAIFHREVNFSKVHFSGATEFIRATFNREVEFDRASFNGEANFYNGTFIRDVSFNGTSFGSTASFNSATFGDYVRFAPAENAPAFGGTSSLTLKFARIEKPGQVSFHTHILRPHWFVNVDARKFDFINVDWDWRSINEEVESLRRKDVPSPHRMLAIACRHLAVNAEENHRYEEASKFRYMAMDAQRLEKWRGFALWRLSWWYWLASGYGERILRAFVVLIGVWFLFAVVYTQVGFARWEPRQSNEREAMTEQRDEVGEPLKLPRALTYSLSVMTFQKPEPHPATTAAQSLVILETILGPLQAALLALAIRRKFMR